MLLDDILVKKPLVLVFDFWYDPTENQFMGRVVLVDVYMLLQIIEVSKRTQRGSWGWIAVYTSVFNGLLSSNFQPCISLHAGYVGILKK